MLRDFLHLGHVVVRNANGSPAGPIYFASRTDVIHLEFANELNRLQARRRTRGFGGCTNRQRICCRTEPFRLGVQFLEARRQSFGLGFKDKARHVPNINLVKNGNAVGLSFFHVLSMEFVNKHWRPLAVGAYMLFGFSVLFGALTLGIWHNPNATSAVVSSSAMVVVDGKDIVLGSSGQYSVVANVSLDGGSSCMISSPPFQNQTMAEWESNRYPLNVPLNGFVYKHDDGVWECSWSSISRNTTPSPRTSDALFVVAMFLFGLAALGLGAYGTVFGLQRHRFQPSLQPGAQQ